MDLKPAPFRSPLFAYEQQAESLLAAHRAADPAAIDLFHRKHPRFLDDKIRWRPKFIPASEIRDSAARNDAPRRDGALVRARSSRVCCFDPPVHRATLLHYVAANGVEAYRQKTPPNAVEIGRTLLEAGAEPDALADMYGADCTTMSMLVSSSHPAEAGLQVPLVELLLDFGAAIEGRGTRKWGAPLFTALTFGMTGAAEVLAKRGASVDLPTAAGLGRVEDAARFLKSADAEAATVRSPWLR